MSTKYGIYPGSFNPFHIGHLDIVEQASKLFDKVIVLRAVNPDKDKPTTKLPADKLSSMGVITASYGGLLTDYVKWWEESTEHDITLIRGFRSGFDAAQELNLIAFLRRMHPTIKIVMLPSKPENQHISSKALRGMQQFSEAEYQKYIVK